MTQFDVRNVHGYSNIFALLFPIARLDLLPICISHPISTILLYSFRIGGLLSWIRISTFFCGFRRLLVCEFILISPVSVRDQTFQASSLIVCFLYKLYRSLGSSLVEFSTWFLSPDLVSPPRLGFHPPSCRAIAPSSGTAGKASLRP